MARRGDQTATELRVDPSRPLRPGRYGRSDFTPPIAFDVPPEQAGRWVAIQAADGFFDVEREVGTPDVIAVQFARVAAVHGVDGGAATAPSAEDAVKALQSNEGLKVLETSPAVMAGRTGPGLTLDHAGGGDAFRPVVDVPAGPISIGPGRRLWIGFFEVGGWVPNTGEMGGSAGSPGLLAILVGGSVERWAEAVTAAQPILAGVTIGSVVDVP